MHIITDTNHHQLFISVNSAVQHLHVGAWGMGGYRLWYILFSSCHNLYGIVTRLRSQEILDWDKGPARNILGDNSIICS